MLVAVVVAIAATAGFDLTDHGVSTVGTLPDGFPPLTWPGTGGDLPLLVAGALGIAVVALADTISTASAFAARTGQELDGNKEMVGIGAANVAAGFFQGFPASTSGSRTAVAAQAGAKTQLTGLVGAAAIALMLVLAPGLLRNLPDPTLAAVVIAASLSLADIPGTVRLWRQRRVEFMLSIAAFLGVALVGVLEGIAVAVALSILNVFRRSWWPYQTTLGRVPGMPGHHDREMHPEAEQLPGLVIFRFDAPLFFANARTFRDQIRRLAAAEPRPHWIVIAAEPITDVDTTAADMLEDLDEELNAAGTRLVFAELKDPVRAKLERYELIGPLDPRTSSPPWTRPSTPTAGRPVLSGPPHEGHEPRLGRVVLNRFQRLAQRHGAARRRPPLRRRERRLRGADRLHPWRADRKADLGDRGPRSGLFQEEWQVALTRRSFTGEAQLLTADGVVVDVQFAAHAEVVTGRRLVLAWCSAPRAGASTSAGTRR